VRALLEVFPVGCPVDADVRERAGFGFRAVTGVVRHCPLFRYVAHKPSVYECQILRVQLTAV